MSHGTIHTFKNYFVTMFSISVFDFSNNEFVWIQLKTEKHYKKIIFKCVNSTVRSIFNEKVAKKWNLWDS